MTGNYNSNNRNKELDFADLDLKDNNYNNGMAPIDEDEEAV